MECLSCWINMNILSFLLVSLIAHHSTERYFCARIAQVRRALALKLERKVRQLQADLVAESDNSLTHRARDAVYFRAR